MRKIITVLAMVLFSVASNAQPLDNYKIFKVGEYVFENETWDFQNDIWGGREVRIESGFFLWKTKDLDEARNLYNFMKNNITKLNKKFGVVLEDLDFGWSDKRHSYVVFMTVSEYNYYVQIKEMERMRRIEEKAEKEKRVNSLQNIF